MRILIFTAEGNLITSCESFEEVGTVLRFHPTLTALLPDICAGKATTVGNYLIVKEEAFINDDDCNAYSDYDRVLQESMVDEPVFSEEEEQGFKKFEDLYEDSIDLLDEKIAFFNREWGKLDNEEIEDLLDALYDDELRYSVFYLKLDGEVAYDCGCRDGGEIIDLFLNEMYPNEEAEIRDYKACNDDTEPSEEDLVDFMGDVCGEISNYIYHAVQDAIVQGHRWVRLYNRLVSFKRYQPIVSK